jgi:hypothetical protein
MATALSGRKKDMARATAVRRAIIASPDIEAKELFGKWEAKWGEKPKDELALRQLMYSARAQLKHRWGDIKKLQGGQQTPMIQHVLKKHPDWDLEKVQKFIGQDGIEVTKATFEYARRHMTVHEVRKAANSPDAKKLTGPRKRKGDGRSRKHHDNGEQHEVHVEGVSQRDTAEAVETALDNLISIADNMGQDSLVKRLKGQIRDARRTASALCVQHSK